MGMLATVINALALQDRAGKRGFYTRVHERHRDEAVGRTLYSPQSAAAPRERTRRDFRRGHREIRIFSTDTAAALRAMEIKADVILKATRVDGIYDADPEQVADAKFFQQITYRDVLHQGLKVRTRRRFPCAWTTAFPSWCSHEYAREYQARGARRACGSTVTPA